MNSTPPPNLAPPLAELFDPAGGLAAALPGYEPRPAQQFMAQAVFDILDSGLDASAADGCVLAAEAETGVGKTLAYLIPAVLSGQKVVVSTATLNLQEQILHKEIPFLLEHVDPRLTVVCVKGRQNYLCLYRWQRLAQRPEQNLFGEESRLSAIADWLAETETGDRAELDWLPDNAPLWRELSATTAQCLGNRCPDEAACFISRLRKKAAAARLLIVNHHLFFSDLALRRHGHGEVLPRYEAVIFDEAHHLEAMATRYFGISFSSYQLLDLAHDLLAAGDTLPRDEAAALHQAVQEVTASLSAFAAVFPAARGRFPLPDFARNNPDWAPLLTELDRFLARLASRLDGLSVQGEAWSALLQRTADLLGSLRQITGFADQQTHVYWYERREKTVGLTASPISIAGELAEALYERVRSCVFCSATLTVGGSFSYFFEQMGLPDDTPTLALASPFDYAGRTLLYVPGGDGDQDFPAPGDTAYPERVGGRLLELLAATSGRALVLFTSVQAMQAAAEFLAPRLSYPLLVQGDAPRNRLLAQFTRETSSVLLAVASFWEGVDVPGEALSAVIIDKLQFEVPSDPVIMARINRIRENGGNPFIDFQVPRAVLSLRQGVGRLMRASSDRGLLALLDVRLFTKRYGKLFLKSLPPSPVSRSLAEVRGFFQHD